MNASVTPTVGVIFKSYEPLSSMMAYARETESGKLMGGFWIAEAYHWFRKYGHEARGCMATLAAVALNTETIPIGLGITSPYMRHPTIQASEAAAIDELSNGRFIMGLGVGKVGVEYLEYDLKVHTPVKMHRESIEIFRKVLSGEAYSYKGDLFESEMPAVDRAARGLRTEIPMYMGATGPLMQKLAGKMADGLLLPGLTSPGFVRYAREKFADGCAKVGRQLSDDFPVGGVILASCSRDGAKAKDAARSYTATYVINKIRNIKNDVILSSSGLPDETWEPFRKAIAEGTEDNVTHLVNDDMMCRFTVIAGEPDECTELLQQLVDAGLNLPLMEVVGADEAANLETIKLLGSYVVPNLNAAAAAA